MARESCTHLATPGPGGLASHRLGMVHLHVRLSRGPRFLGLHFHRILKAVSSPMSHLSCNRSDIVR